MINLAEYNLTDKLTKLKHSMVSNHNDRNKMVELLNKTINLIKEYNDLYTEEEYSKAIDLKSPESFLRDMYYAEGTIQDMLEYLDNPDNETTGDEYINLHLSILDTYFVYLDTEGTDVERVSWMQSTINNFLEEFKYLKEEDITDDYYELITQVKGDIEVTLDETFDSSLIESLTRLDEFESKVKSLNI